MIPNDTTVFRESSVPSTHHGKGEVSPWLENVTQKNSWKLLITEIVEVDFVLNRTP